MDEENLIFLSYASPDRDAVMGFHASLQAAGYNVWMDRFRLKGGQAWDVEVKRAMRKATIIVVFLSSHSVDRRGYAQREVKIALEQLKDRLVDDIYLIPVMLEPGLAVPDQLADIQAVGLDGQDADTALKDAIDEQLSRLGAKIAQVQADANLQWTDSVFEDKWDGLPGYDVSYHLPRFTSRDYPGVAEITDVLRGWLQGQVMGQRTVKFDQSPDLYSFAETRFSRQNSWEASYGEPQIRGRVLSIAFSIWWYGAKAAHPNHQYQTFAFTLDPVTRISELREIFVDPDAGFKLVQSESRRLLLALDLDGDMLPPDQIASGTETWDDFSDFLFTADGLDIFFPPYQVAAYAYGPQHVRIAYDLLTDLLLPLYAQLLDATYLGAAHRNPPWDDTASA